MEETIQKTDILLQNQPEPLQETPQNPTKKEILRKRKRNFNIYGENFEASNDFDDHSDYFHKPYRYSNPKRSFTRSKILKKRYRTRNPVEKAIFKYFSSKKNNDVLDYDDLIEKGFIVESSVNSEEPLNTQSVKNSAKKKIKKKKLNNNSSTLTSKIFSKKKEKKNYPNPENVNLLKIHLENRKNSINPIILDKKVEKAMLAPMEEKKNEENVNVNYKNLTKQENENVEKIAAPTIQNNNHIENFDYEKLFFIPKFQKVMDQNYSNLSNTEKTYYQNLFYNRLMHFNNSFDYFNPYYNSNLFGLPDIWNNNFNNPLTQLYQKNVFSNPLSNLMSIPEEEIKIIGKDEFYKNKSNILKNNEPFNNPLIKDNKPNFFDFVDYSRINERSLSTNEKLPNLLENIKLNNNSLFEFPIIKKKVNYKKKDKMKNWKNNNSTEKVIPFISTSVENILKDYPFNSHIQCDDIIDCDSILCSNSKKKIVIGHKRTKTFYKFNKNSKMLQMNSRVEEKLLAKNEAKIKINSNHIENPAKKEGIKNTNTIDHLYEKLNLNGLDIVENENFMIVDFNEESKKNKEKELEKDAANHVLNEKLGENLEKEKTKNMLFGAYNSEQLKEYMFQKHKINVGKKFQAEIPKFNNSKDKSDSDSSLTSFHEWRNNVVNEKEFEEFHKKAIEKIGININEEEAANLISVYGYNIDKASNSLDTNLYYLREYLLEKRKKRKR